jgi:hypothetical protein
LWVAEERARLHPVPAVPFTAALGVTRKVDASSLISFEAGQYSVPHQLAGQAVWVRRHGEQVVIAHAGPGGVREVARQEGVMSPKPPPRTATSRGEVGDTRSYAAAMAVWRRRSAQCRRHRRA